MPHTTTKNARSKRIDTRPNEKQRRKQRKMIEDKKSIQDLRVTKVQKDFKKERLAQPTKLANLSKNEKLIRSLN